MATSGSGGDSLLDCARAAACHMPSRCGQRWAHFRLLRHSLPPTSRGSGRGDSLLDYVEQDARARGIQRLVLLTTRTADWFEQRDFRWQVRGAAGFHPRIPCSFCAASMSLSSLLRESLLRSPTFPTL